MSETLTNLEIGVSHAISYKLHPSVIVNILDVYYRNTSKDFVLGVLLGNIYPDYVKITNVVFVPSGVTATGEIAIDNELLNRLLEYNKKVFNETRVGWFITKTKIDSQVAVIHKHLLPNLKSQTNTWGGPVILLVDPTLNNDKVNLLGYVSQANRMFRECFALFRPVKVDVELFDTSLTTGQLLYGTTDQAQNSMDNKSGQSFVNALGNAKFNIQKLQEKFASMTQEEVSQHPELMKEIKSLLASRFSVVNDNNKPAIERFIEDNHHLRYLNNLAHLQLILSERLSNKVEHTE